jgi:hypothetical protein
MRTVGSGKVYTVSLDGWLLLDILAPLDDTAARNLAQPPGGGSLLLTDLIVSSSRQAGGSVTLRFTDGTDTENIAVFDSANAPVSVGLSLAGRWQGWADARLEVVVAGGAANATVAVGYCKVPASNTLQYNEWSDLR